MADSSLVLDAIAKSLEHLGTMDRSDFWAINSHSLAAIWVGSHPVIAPSLEVFSFFFKASLQILQTPESPLKFNRKNST